MVPFSKGQTFDFRKALKKAGYPIIFGLRLFLYAKYYNENTYRCYSYHSRDEIDNWCRWNVSPGRS